MNSNPEMESKKRQTQVEATVDYLEREKRDHPVKYWLAQVASFGMGRRRMILEAALRDTMIENALLEERAKVASTSAQLSQ